MPSDSESPPRNIRPTPPPELPARQPNIELSKFEPFPELEPFPFKPDPPRPEKKKLPGIPPVRKPGKFVRGESRESDYESDLEGARIAPRWVPPGSDTDDAVSYKKVQPKLSSEEPRTSRAVSKEPTPPSQFDVPPEMDGPPRPQVLPVEMPEMTDTLTESVDPIMPVHHPMTAIKSASSEVGLAMEKSWVPKRVEMECAKTLPRMSSPSGHPRPSAKALEMEKQWSHRFTSHSSKIWPPPATGDHETSNPIWTGQASTSSTTKSMITSSQTVGVVDEPLECVTSTSNTKKSILKQTTTTTTAGLSCDVQPSQPIRRVQIQGEIDREKLELVKAVASAPALKSQVVNTCQQVNSTWLHSSFAGHQVYRSNQGHFFN